MQIKSLTREIKHFMTPDIICLDQSTSVYEVCKLMAKKRISCVVITSKSKPKGIITERDIVQKIVSKDRNPKEIKSASVMGKPILSARKDTDLINALILMRSKKIRRLIVINGKHNIVGLITQTDVINALYKILMGKLREIHNIYTRTQKLFKDSVKALFQALDAKDHYTGSHSRGVAKLAEAIALEMKLGKRGRRDIYLAGLFHDIGKIRVSDKVLNKKGSLLPDEYEEIKLHPLTSEAILKPITEFKDILQIIRSHHEWYNGKGYPEGLKKNSIPVGARIISVADCYNAMRTHRPYRGAISRAEAISNIKKSAGTQFDPEVVEAFLKAVKKHKRF